MFPISLLRWPRPHQQLWRPIPGWTKILGWWELWFSEVHDVYPGLREPYSAQPSPLPCPCLCECSGVIPEFDLGQTVSNRSPVGGSNDAWYWPVGPYGRHRHHPAVHFYSLYPSPLHCHSPGHPPGKDTGEIEGPGLCHLGER